MCGIAGVVGTKDPHAMEAVKKMVSALARRGPDSEGIERWDQTILGHRRLAIFDLSQAGRQPMVSADGSIGVVFNGAIYNFKKLRKGLMASGYAFMSNTDTEVLVHGYREWGIDKLITMLTGMFAFGLWDNRTRKLYLVRDRLGVKPLVYAVREGVLAFASTLGALRRGEFVADLNENAVMDFLEFGFVPDDKCIYRGAIKVPAASIVEWSDGNVDVRKYWAPPAPPPASSVSFHEAVEETERLLLKSVEIRLHADVPVGALLSGGIDSALVCWAVKKLGANITTYTVGTPGDPWDETKDAIETARLLGIRHHILEMSAEDTPEIEELVSAYAEPFACASALGMLKISRVIAESVKVLLTGDGGDDVFLGYPEHRHLWLAQKLSATLPSAVTDLWYASRSSFPRIGPLRRAAALLDYATAGLGTFANNQTVFSSCKGNGFLGERLLSAPVDRGSIPLSHEAGRRVLQDFIDYHLKTRFVAEYMTKVDGATMHYGLEARSPFLDHNLWEFASLLPFELRLRRGRLKAVLRELVRLKIGKTVANKLKRGFGIPAHRWMVGRWLPLVEAALQESILDDGGWIHAKAVRKQLQSSVFKGFASKQLWYIFVLESWMKYQYTANSESVPAGSQHLMESSEAAIRNIRS
jgi:asparagine synthase (glutamine-hydrolysing)